MMVIPAVRQIEDSSCNNDLKIEYLGTHGSDDKRKIEYLGTQGSDDKYVDDVGCSMVEEEEEFSPSTAVPSPSVEDTEDEDDAMAWEVM